MRVRTMMLRRVFAVVAAAGLFSAFTYLKFKTDAMKDEFDRAHEVMHQCSRLRLAMTRDEVVQLMGQPVREYDVRPNGRGTAAFYKELLYNMPMSSQPAYVDLDLETSRVIEITCSEDHRVSLPESMRSVLKDEDNGPLPSDQPIPTGSMFPRF